MNPVWCLDTFQSHYSPPPAHPSPVQWEGATWRCGLFRRILGPGRSVLILGDSMNLGFYYSLWNNMLVNATSKGTGFRVSGFGFRVSGLKVSGIHWRGSCSGLIFWISHIISYLILEGSVIKKIAERGGRLYSYLKLQMVYVHVYIRLCVYAFMCTYVHTYICRIHVHSAT